MEHTGIAPRLADMRHPLLSERDTTAKISTEDRNGFTLGVESMRVKGAVGALLPQLAVFGSA